MAIADAPDLTPEVFDVHLMIDETARQFEQPARDKGLVLEIKTAAVVPQRAIGEREWLREVLVGIVANAVRFTDRGEVVASVTATQTSSRRTLLHAEISDTGCGMPPNRVESLFGNGSCGSRPSDAEGGARSSLQVARRLIELMDGQLGCSSAAGTGTTAWFTVPLDLP